MAQEALKVCLRKFTPLNQWLFFEALNCLPDGDPQAEPCSAQVDSRYLGQIEILGTKIQQLLMNRKLFLVGAGTSGIGSKFLIEG